MPLNSWNTLVGSSQAYSRHTMSFGPRGRAYAFDETETLEFDGANVTQIWQSSYNGNANYSAPVFYEGDIFYGQHGGVMHSVDASTGNLNWTFTDLHNQVHPSPAVGNGAVFIADSGDDKGTLFKIDIQTGNQIWSFGEPTDPIRSDIVYNDGNVYFGHRNNKFFSVDSGPGSNKNWKADLTSSVNGAPAIKDGILYPSTKYHGIWAVEDNGNSRNILWNDATAARCRTRVEQGQNGRLYLGDDANNLYAYKAGTTKNRLWKFTTPSGSVRGNPKAIDGTVYVGSLDNNLYAVDGATGTEKWRFNSGASIRTGVRYLWGVLYFGNDNGDIIALDRETGKEIWRYTTSNTIRTTPEKGDGRIYVVNVNGDIYAIDPVNRFSGTTSTATLTSMTTGRNNLDSASANNNIYVLGGNDGSSTKATNEEYDPIANSWSSSVTDMQRNREKHVSVTGPNGYVYVFGGEDGAGALHSKVDRYDPVNDTWTEMAQLPNTSRYGAAVHANGYIYYGGGEDGVGLLQSFARYDVGNDTWSTSAVSDLPVPLTKGALEVGASGNLYAIWGRDSNGRQNFIYKYDVAGDSWSQSSVSQNNATDFLASATGPEGDFYVHGGEDSGGTEDSFYQGDVGLPTPSNFTSMVEVP